MSKRINEILLADIFESIGLIDKYTKNFDKAKFLKSRKTQDAVIRNLEIIGEAANKLTHDFHIQHHKVNWKGIVGLRNRIIHEYFGIDLDIIWQIINKDLVKLKKELRKTIKLPKT